MSKVGSKMRNIKKVVEKIDHSTKLRTNIPAGLASAAPPLGPQLGQRGINIAAFVKDFNERTKDVKEGVPLPCRVYVNSDRSYSLVIHTPPASYFLKQAAGIQRGTMGSGDIVGKITLKHLYEIAAIKLTDPPNALMTLQQMCNALIGTARSVGIEVVKDIDPVEYAQFLEERKVIVDQQKKELQEKREAKMLRTA